MLEHHKIYFCIFHSAKTFIPYCKTKYKAATILDFFTLMFDTTASVLERFFFFSFVDVVTTHLILFKHDQIIKLMKLLKIQTIFLYAHFLWKQNRRAGSKKRRMNHISLTSNEVVIHKAKQPVSKNCLKAEKVGKVPAVCPWTSESWGPCSSAQEAETSVPLQRCWWTQSASSGLKLENCFLHFTNTKQMIWWKILSLCKQWQ